MASDWLSHALLAYVCLNTAATIVMGIRKRKELWATVTEPSLPLWLSLSLFALVGLFLCLCYVPAYIHRHYIKE